MINQKTYTGYFYLLWFCGFWADCYVCGVVKKEHRDRKRWGVVWEQCLNVLNLNFDKYTAIIFILALPKRSIGLVRCTCASLFSFNCAMWSQFKITLSSFINLKPLKIIKCRKIARHKLHPIITCDIFLCWNWNLKSFIFVTLSPVEVHNERRLMLMYT